MNNINSNMNAENMNTDIKHTAHPFVISNQNPFHKRVLKREKSENIFKYVGFASIALSLLFLGFLLFTIVQNGKSAFIKTTILITLDFDKYTEKYPDLPAEELLKKISFRQVINDGLKDLAPKAKRRNEIMELFSLISRSSYASIEKQAKQIILETKDFSKIQMWTDASSNIDMYYKGKIDMSVEQHLRKVSDFQANLMKKLKRQSKIKKVFNTTFFVNGDSREAETAGILGSLIGSCFSILICIACALPLGVASAIYLEEYAKKGKLKDTIEILINNLAAIPSIVFGLLGLAIFLNFFGLPRSSSMVGGFTLALLVLPVIIVTARNALAAVPPSIKDAAIGLGASKTQVVLHHVLPLATPGIMTGSILGVARALGETAPLLMIGMVAFVRDIPGNVIDPATALPIQIFIWSDLPEMGFVEKTSAAIMILLAFLITANMLAVYLRKKFEYKW